MSGKGKTYFIHPTAVVEEPCTIGEGTKIWHFTHVMPGVSMGRNCNLGQNVFVGDNVSIGDNVRIQNNVSVYKGVTLEDDVFCGPSCVFTNVKFPRTRRPQRDEFLSTLVKRGATIGANATIVCGHTVGAHAFIGAGSVVTRDIPDYALAYGSPARVRGWVCECGTGLDFGPAGEATCVRCGIAYRKPDDSKIEPLA